MTKFINNNLLFAIHKKVLSVVVKGFFLPFFRNAFSEPRTLTKLSCQKLKNKKGEHKLSTLLTQMANTFYPYYQR